MTGNFVMLQMDDLRQVVTEIVEEVCDKLHITYTTLWRKENEGVIKKHKMGRRNLYSKKEVMDIFSSAMESGNNKCKEECHG